MRKRLNLIFDEYSKNKILFFFLLLSLVFGLVMKNISIFLFLLLIFGVYKIINIVQINKMSKILSEQDLKLIESEIKKPLIINKYKYVVTNHYIIKKGLKIALIKYSDIVLVYRKKRYNMFTNFGKFQTVFVIVDNKNKKYKFLLDSCQLPIFDDQPFIEYVIRNRNSKVHFGYNKKILRK